MSDVFCRHVQRKHQEVYAKYMAQSSMKTDPAQTTMTSMYGGLPSDVYGPKHPMATKLAESLVENLVVSCSVRFAIVEKPEFKAWVHDLNPKFAVPSRQHLSYKVLPQLVDKKTESLRKLLDSAKHVALTLDIWTDRANHSYLAITAHTFVGCSPMSCLLTFSSFRGSHTGARIAEEIEKSIAENRLEGKVDYIVTDNASNMKCALNVLVDMQTESTDKELVEQPDEAMLDDESLWQDLEGDEEVEVQQTIDRQCSNRLPCFAHTVQLVVRDGLSKLTGAPHRQLTAKCSKLCNLVHQSALFKGAFENQFGIGHSLPKANDTRWNSTFRHLKAIAELDQILLAALLREQNQTQLMLSPKDLAILQELIEILLPFAEATDLTQGDTYPTIGCIVPSIIGLDSCLLEAMSKTVHHAAFVRALHESLRRRFLGLFKTLLILPGNLSEHLKPQHEQFGAMIYLMASLLDPSYGLLWLEDHPGSAETKQTLRETVIGKFAICVHCVVHIYDISKKMCQVMPSCKLGTKESSISFSLSMFVLRIFLCTLKRT